MKTLFGLALGFVASIGFVCQAQNVSGQTARKPIPEPTPYAITTQDANSRVWERTVYELDSAGQPVAKKRQYSELASGLNHLVNGNWVESKEQIDILPNGTAAATNGQHQAYFPGDIYRGQIELVTSTGQHLRSRPIGLSYFDGSNSVLIAELTNSIGLVVGSNQVIYTNAFTDFAVDLRYTYTKAGFEQDIILRQQPPTPESLGLNPDTTRLQVLTEFFSPPQPRIQTSRLAAQAGLALYDQNLDFGAMQMIPGRAFLMGREARAAAAKVSKNWLLLNRRQFLVEEVPVDAIIQDLASLPVTAMNSGPNKNSHTASRDLKLPVQRLASNDASQKMLLAKVELPAQGYVLDYQAVNGNLTNVTFNGDSTYYISGALSLYGTLTIEGGTVVKYVSPGPTVLVTGSVNCQTSPYRPAIFTSKNDNTVGETITGSTGTPSIDHSFGCYYLSFYNINQVNLHDLRISYAFCGLTVDTGNLNLSDVQFIHNDYPLYFVNAQGNVYNVLMQDVQQIAFYAALADINVKHLTLDQCPILGAQDATATIALTNCLLTGVPNLGYIPYTTNYFVMLSTNTGVFQTVGGGHYYLATNSPYRNAGTTNIEANVLADIRSATTYPPLLYSNVTVSADTLWAIQAQRDTDTPDLGYHYDPIDYAVGGVDLYAKLNVTNGVAVGWFESINGASSSGQGYGISLNDGANLTFLGTAPAPCWMAKYNTVQEGNWGTRGWMGGVLINGSSGGTNPQLNAGFTKWPGLASENNHFRDNWARGSSSFANCEFYINGISAYDQSSLVFTNCLFFREGVYVFGYGQSTIPNVTFQNCSFYNGFLSMNRYAGQPATVWIVKDNAFDGTGFSFGDNLVGNTNYAIFDYNAYNTNNNSGLSYSYPYTPPPTNRLEIIGAHDVFWIDYNWQHSWLGDFYQPANSKLIDKGDRTAGQVGLYHFTTQTSQVKDANSTVDIGYHYVAVDAYGNPLDTNGDGIPDYLEDANGNGIYDVGESGTWFATVNNGIPSAWYTANGLNASDPLIGIKDADMDGLLNQQEYFYGTNPQISEGFSIWLSTPSTTTSIP